MGGPGSGPRKMGGSRGKRSAVRKAKEDKWIRSVSTRKQMREIKLLRRIDTSRATPRSKK